MGRLCVLYAEYTAYKRYKSPVLVAFFFEKIPSAALCTLSMGVSSGMILGPAPGPVGGRGGGCQIKQERDPFVTHARRTEVLCVSYKKCIHSSSTEVKSHLVRPASPDEPEVESTR